MMKFQKSVHNLFYVYEWFLKGKWVRFEDEHKVYVLEISSFQLDNIKKFHPKIAVITNLSPDHFDRYQNSFENLQF